MVVTLRKKDFQNMILPGPTLVCGHSNRKVWGLLLVTFLLTQCVGAQTKSTAVPSSLVNPSHVPSPVRSFIAALGDRVQKPGNERTTLVGTCTTPTGTGPCAFVWEAPGRARFDRADQPGHPLI